MCPAGAPCLGTSCGFEAIATGGEHTCGLRGGSALCWGANATGQIGDGTLVNRALPTAVMGISGLVQIEAGFLSGTMPGWGHSCARQGTGAVSCWGRNDYGQVGDGSTTERRLPAAVVGLTDAAEVRLGTRHSCARRSDGSVACWGRNSDGQLGNGTTSDRITPASVSGISGALEIAAGSVHACARLASSVRCWGQNANGQIGDGTLTNRLSPVTLTSLPSDVVQLALGGDHSCSLHADGRVRCWGLNVRGQLGDGTTTRRISPVLVSGLSSAVEITAGEEHTCARLSTGGVRCWGANSGLQLGVTGADRTTPVDLPGITDATAIRAGGRHTCMMRPSGTYCWGSNDLGQLGDGSSGMHADPRPVVP